MADLSERFRTIGMEPVEGGVAGCVSLYRDGAGLHAAGELGSRRTTVIFAADGVEPADEIVVYDTPEDAAAACEWLVASWLESRWLAMGFGHGEDGNWEYGDDGDYIEVEHTEYGEWLVWLDLNTVTRHTAFEDTSELTACDFVAALLALAGEA